MRVCGSRFSISPRNEAADLCRMVPVLLMGNQKKSGVGVTNREGRGGVYFGSKTERTIAGVEQKPAEVMGKG